MGWNEAMETTTGVTTRRLEGRVALVTGAASGIGAATARRLGEEGAAVVVTDVADEAGETIARYIRGVGGQALFTHHDASEEADWVVAVAAAISEFGGLDVLVNNAGFGDLAMSVAGDALKASGHGSVVNISSMYASENGYGTVRILTQNAALNWAQQGVRVNSVHPGFMLTPVGRLAGPEEVAACVAFLASDDATFVTGSELYVDGC